MTSQCSHDISIWFLKYLDTSNMHEYIFVFDNLEFFHDYQKLDDNVM